MDGWSVFALSLRCLHLSQRRTRIRRTLQANAVSGLHPDQDVFLLAISAFYDGGMYLESPRIVDVLDHLVTIVARTTAQAFVPARRYHQTPSIWSLGTTLSISKALCFNFLQAKTASLIKPRLLLQLLLPLFPCADASTFYQALFPETVGVC
jgi:hypothetical protein